ncbi:ATP-binding protein [Actinoplanes sp. NPDC051851]|uniref:NACHT domain-containing protein n=1 Tax=Actinoplanes sp. NPDC051851 TaxID=3154753 RepID=UPI0034145489
MARSRMSYVEAVRILTGGDDRVTVLGRLAGGALLLATPVDPDVVLGLFDAKGEANSLLRELWGKAPARIRSSRGKRHYELIEAAHHVLVVSAFFDALAELIGPRQFAGLELTEEEKERLGGGVGTILRDPNATLADLAGGLDATLDWVDDVYNDLEASFRDFVGGLAAGGRLRLPPTGKVTGLALNLYQEGYGRLAVDVPEFGFWAQLGAVRRQGEALAGLSALLAGIVDAPTPASDAVHGLARHYAEVLRRPLWRSDAPAPVGLTFPSVERGFVSPRFRVAHADRGARLSDESWWEQQPEQDDLDMFLAHHLADPESTQRPLIVLGHPGAGKSLLTEILAARLPAAAYTTIRVPLRRVNPDAPIYQQIEAAIQDVTRERITWGDLGRAVDTTKVVLLDGFDELVQATGVTQSHYVEQAATFQREEWVQGRPVIIVITSRTLVMDRTVVHDGTPVLKLEPFDRSRVAAWATAWNVANSGQPGFRPLTVDELWRHEELAAQPLLLLMLAVYSASTGALDADGLSTDQLYRRLLDTFIRRQVREKSTVNLGETRYRQLEAESRRDLAAVAFAMFNRGLQYVGEEDLQRDLEALHPERERPPVDAGEPVSRSQRTVSGFFFVHEARVPGRRSYEFLHATFAEYLVAEQTMELLTDLAEDWSRARRRHYRDEPGDRVLRQLLSHQPVTSSEKTFAFLTRMIGALEESARADLCEAVLEAFRAARTRIQDDQYRPTPFDVMTRTAAYTANLLVIALICRPEGLGDIDVRSTVRLWRGGLDSTAQTSLFARLERTGDRVRVVDPRPVRKHMASEAELVGDLLAEAVIAAGEATMLSANLATRERPERTAFQRDFHILVTRLFAWRWLIRTDESLIPFDERLYHDLLACLDGQFGGVPWPASGTLLSNALLHDASALPTAVTDRLIREVLIPLAVLDRAFSVDPALLALTHPWLMVRIPQLRNVVVDTNAPELLHEVAVFNRAKDPALMDPIIEALSVLGGKRAIAEPIPYATPSMIAGFRGMPGLMAGILGKLADFGEISWQRIRPVDLLASIDDSGLDPSLGLRRSAFEMAAGGMNDALSSYTAYWGRRALSSEDAAAMVRLRQLLAGG